MANFQKAQKITHRNEGGYANNPNDRGGETYAGVARKFHPEWRGWIFVDEAVGKYVAKHNKRPSNNWNASSFFRSIGQNYDAERLEQEVNKLYKHQYWDVLQLDGLNDQDIANQIYDFGVNAGVSRSAKMLQQAFNESQNGKLAQDGKIGAKTLGAINALSSQGLAEVYNKFRELRIEYYQAIASRDPSQIGFLAGWTKRAGDPKSLPAQELA